MIDWTQLIWPAVILAGMAIILPWSTRGEV